MDNFKKFIDKGMEKLSKTFDKTAESNKSIACTVTDCKNHCKNNDYCSLNKIKIEAHKANPTACENVDCKSFEQEF